jgi:shikimate dehydrogenase
VINGTTRIAAVLGWPVEHSRSPQMINAAFAATTIDAVMVPIGVAPEGFATVVAGLRAGRALGASVTRPHKVAAAALCTELSEAARGIGAVNCLHFIDDRVSGHNTDCGAFVDGLVAAGFDANRPCRLVLLGGGGAARAIAYALRHATWIHVLARRPREVDLFRDSSDASRVVMPWTGDSLRSAFSEADLVVDCTPIGLGGADEAMLVDELPLDVLPRAAWIASLVYHRPTLMLERARALGHSVVDGRAMLVHQGARAFTIWTGQPAPVVAMSKALDDALRSGT